jgi:outer membrane protein OmpA-like peptidoglycan-associated protein
MKFRTMATGLALALLTLPAPVAHAGQGEIILAQADADTMQKFNELVADTRPVSTLTDKELSARLTLIPKLLANKDLAKPQVRQLRKMAKEAREESKNRRLAKKEADKTKKQEEASGQDVTEAEQQPSAPAAPAAKTDDAKTAEPQTTQKPAAEELKAESEEAKQEQPPAPFDPNAESAAMKFLTDTANVDRMTAAELKIRIRQGRSILKNASTPQSLVPQLRERQRAMRLALESGGNTGQQPSADQQPGAGQQQSTANQQQQPAPGAPAAADMGQRAQTILSDARPSTSLSTADLQERLRETRQVLAARNLAGPVANQLRGKLDSDRTEFRRRKAAEQGQNGTGGNKGQVVQLQSDEFYLKDVRRPETLKTPELERRVLVMRIAVVDTRYPADQRNFWRQMIEADRAVLHRRALDERRRREAEWRQRRDSGNLNIAINIDLGPGDDGYGRPRPIYLAEADDRDVERYLAAAPARPPARRYTIDEVRTMPEVRQTMPAVEIDTIKFGFNEDFVREEALDDLDRVGEAIEKILTAHPGEVFLVEGHTDAVGSDEYNLDLSRRRADSVKKALATYYNIDARNIETAGYGEQFLRIQTEEAEEENRRVTIRRATPLVGEAG